MIWIRYRPLIRPYYDPRSGDVLQTVEQRRNRAAVDPFAGGGKVYPPEILSDRVRDQIETETGLFLLLDITEAEAQAIVDCSELLECQLTPRRPMVYNRAELDAVIATEEEVFSELGLVLPEDNRAT